MHNPVIKNHHSFQWPEYETPAPNTITHTNAHTVTNTSAHSYSKSDCCTDVFLCSFFQGLVLFL